MFVSTCIMFMYVCLCLYVCLFVYMLVCLYVCVYVCVCELYDSWRNKSYFHSPYLPVSDHVIIRWPHYEALRIPCAQNNMCAWILLTLISDKTNIIIANSLSSRIFSILVTGKSNKITGYSFSLIFLTITDKTK